MQYNISDIKKNIIGKLQKQLPDYLTYHNVDHTLYVADKAVLICKKENVSKKNEQLVHIAALYHDSGFIKGPKNHEEASCKIVRRDLKGIVQPADLDKICGMIMATKIPQSPKSHNEEILADADLEYLGTKAFEETGERLFQELKHFNPKFTRKDWDSVQYSFLSAHRYKTKFCRQYREKYKIKHVQELKSNIK